MKAKINNGKVINCSICQNKKISGIVNNSNAFCADVMNSENINANSTQRGPQGIPGEAATIQLGTVTTGAAGSDVIITNSGTENAAVFNFTIPRGDRGEQGEQGIQGETGNGIASVELTSTSGLVDTYTITFTDGNTTTFNVTNGQDGNGIVSIEKTSTSGLVDTYTITFDNGNTETFTVTNGQKGDTGSAATISVGSTTTGAAGTSASVTNSGTSSAAVLDFVIPRGVQGETGATGADGYSPTATVTKSGDTATITITDKNGTTTATVSDGSSGASSVSQLTDVDLTGLSNGDVLVYDSTSQEWKAEAQSGSVTDVEVNGESVVTDGVAEIDLTGYQKKLTAGTDLEIVEGSTLPTGYVQLKSITSTTTQYINTKISMTANYKAVIVGRLTQQPSSNFSTILGANNLNNDAATQGRFDIILGWGNAVNGFYTENCIPLGDTFGYTYSSYPWDTETHTFTITVTPTQTTLNIDGTIDAISRPPAAWDTPTPLYLFARNIAASGSIGNITPFELEKIEQYQNGVLVFNGIPCKLGDIVGLYNTVTNEFLPNSGTGAFVEGDVIPNETVINFTNESGYITDITSAQVTNALGYTPYNSTNPNRYISGITSSDVTTALGYTPYNATNPNGYTSNVGTVTSVNNELPDANGNVTVQSGSSRNIGEIVTSTIPLTDAGLHLLDGALISGSGSYSAFVDYIAGLVTDYPDLFDTEANWQSAVTQYGICEKFVYDNTNNTVRLPKYGNQIYTGGTVPVLGNGMSVGLTTNTNNLGTLGISTDDATNRTYAYAHTPATLPATLTGVYLTNVTRTAVGITTDSTKSGIISNPEDISMDCYYYIVVATSTKTDIQVDIDEIATDLNGKADTDFSNVTDAAKIAMANASMPSDTYENLYLGASGTTYTAPADGWFTVRITSTGGTGIAYVTLNSSELLTTRDSNYHPSTATNISLNCSIPVKKGSVVTINYSVMPTVSNKTLRFIYAEGSKSEAI